MNYLQNNYMRTMLVGICAVGSLATITHAQYQWTSLETAVSKWSLNGTSAYKTNVGSVVVGSNFPDGDLLLDVEGLVGGTQYCDNNGSNCFTAEEIQWRANGGNQYANNTGNIGIGISNPTQKLHVSGNVLATTYTYPSDESLKHNIETLDGLDIISRLNGVRFQWTKDGTQEIGFIAQEVEQVLPELVHTDPETGYKSVEYLNIVAPLIEALKQQQEELDQLQQEINMVKNKR